MSKELTYVIIANGGYLKNPVKEIIYLSESDAEFAPHIFDTFDEYVESVIEEAKNEYEQKFASSVVLTLTQYNNLIKS